MPMVGTVGKSSSPRKRPSPSTSTPIIDFSKRPKKGRTGRTIWNSTDDWEELVIASTLSTSSVSRRRPLPRGLHTLVKCATEAAARGFKEVWGDGRFTWTDPWATVPDHLKVKVRDAVFEIWGSFLTMQIIHDVFTVAPELHLSANLQSLASAKHLKPIHPKSDSLPLISSLILKDLKHLPDVAIAGLVYKLPNLEVVNLKGCALAGKKTVETLTRCSRIRRLNLKGTKIGEDDARILLDQFGNQLQGFKIDQYLDFDPSSAEEPFPHLTHLSVKVRPKSLIDSAGKLSFPLFPNITHLEISKTPFNSETRLRFTPNSLVKISLGNDDHRIPLEPLVELLEHHSETLRNIRVYVSWGNASTSPIAIQGLWERLCAVLGRIKLEKLFWEMHPDQLGRAVRFKSMLSVLWCSQLVIGPWHASLRRLYIRLPEMIPADIDLLESAEGPIALEEAYLPSTSNRDIEETVEFLAKCTNLRILDLSNTVVTDEHLFFILDHCPHLHTIDLTSCRGVQVKNRRNIFRAWKESRAESVRPT